MEPMSLLDFVETSPAPPDADPVSLLDFVEFRNETNTETRDDEFRGEPNTETRDDKLNTETRDETKTRNAETRNAVAQKSTRAVVGGVDYAVGGWGDYEIEKRRARFALGAPGASARERYAGRARIGGADAVESILGAAPSSALGRAAARLADTLGVLEERLCDGARECLSSLDPGERYLTVPPVTSADLREFATEGADADAMYDLSEDVTALVAAVTKTVLPPLPPIDFPPLPARIVPIGNEEGVLRLEAAVAPRVAAVEDLRAALATQLELAGEALRRRLEREPAPRR
ncbi:MAG: hypothetical protein WC700_04100 [Gemmatimonadaceae bacterium]|jgi:hypothetical protein